MLPPARLGMYGNWMLDLPNITTTQPIVSSPIAITQANIEYRAGITIKANAFGTANATLSVIDTVTQSVLASCGSLDPGAGPIFTVKFTPTTTDPVAIKVDVVPVSGQPATTVDLDYAGLYPTNIYGIEFYSQRNITVKNGNVYQGQARSSTSNPIYAVGAGFTLDSITASANGIDTKLVDGNWNTGTTHQEFQLHWSDRPDF